MMGVPLRARPRLRRGRGPSGRGPGRHPARTGSGTNGSARIRTSSARASGSTASPTPSSASWPRSRRVSRATELSVPLAFTPEQINHDFHWLLVMGRLKPGVTLAQANADMTTVSAAASRRPFPPSNTGWSASVEPLKNNFLPRQTQTALVAAARRRRLRAAHRLRERRQPAARARHGAAARARRARVGRRQPRPPVRASSSSESLVLALLGGALGVALASLLLRAIIAIMPDDTLPSEADVTLNLPVLAVHACCVSRSPACSSGACRRGRPRAPTPARR